MYVLPLPAWLVAALFLTMLGTGALGFLGDAHHWDRPFLINVTSAAFTGSVGVLVFVAVVERGRRRRVSGLWIG